MRWSRRFGPLLALAGALVAFGAGCGGGEESSSQASTGTPIRTITIEETEFKLTPSTVNLSRPGTYEFRAVNKGTAQHALEIDGNGVEEETATIGPGETASVTVELGKDGSYELYCPVGNHRDLGMEGAVNVGSGSASATTSTGDSGSSGYG
jgi:uncharacterized cupredoxin-like copper-binding protein